jgi:hypothetical protein
MNDIDDHKNLHIAYLENVLASIDLVPRDELAKMYFKNKDECDLGKWMNENCDRFRGFKSNANLSERHKQFHDVLSLAVQSQVQGATKEVVDGLIKEARRLCFSISELIDMLSRHIDEENGRGKV